ncbi:MAG: hypothetical protein WAT46_18210 [Saprospiraceae bacterium]
MFSKNRKFALLAIGLLVLSVTFSSCNRGGYGCPYELKSPIKIGLSIVK